MGDYMLMEVFLPKEAVVFHCCHLLEMVAAESVEMLGVEGQ